MKSLVPALLAGGLLRTTQASFAEFQFESDAASFIPKAKAELAALSENGRTAFRRALIACSLYADKYNNPAYKQNCKEAAKIFTVEFSNERATLSAVLGLANSVTGRNEVGNKIAVAQGGPAPIDVITNRGGKAYIAALQKAYSETNFHASGAATAPNVQPSTVSPSRTTVFIPLQRDGGTYVVPVLINKAITRDFVIDSGATDVSIPYDVFMTLFRTGIVQNTDLIGRQTYKLADGSTDPSPTFRIRSLTVNKLEIENVKAMIAPTGGELLLGQSFLSRFKSWSIDNAKQALVLTP